MTLARAQLASLLGYQAAHDRHLLDSVRNLLASALETDGDTRDALVTLQRRTAQAATLLEAAIEAKARAVIAAGGPEDLAALRMATLPAGIALRLARAIDERMRALGGAA